MGVMTASRTELPDDRPLTVDDLDLLPEDGYKYELDDGVLVVSPPPAINHQLVLHRLSMLLQDACPREYLILPGPGVEMTKFQYRIPDLVVITVDNFDIEAKSLSRPPVLAVEIASPSTAIYDMNRKREVYASFGIASYWIVRPSSQEPRLTAFELRGGSYCEIAEASGSQTFSAARPFPVEVVPAALVAGPWSR